MPTTASPIKLPQWLIPVGIVLVILIVLGFILVLALNPSQPSSPIGTNSTSITSQETSTSLTASDSPTLTISWSFDGNKWQANTTPPACTEPLEIAAPIDMNLVTNILYPGQVRGGDYKPHGGFRFDSAPNNSIEVRMPITATIYRGSRYIEGGEIQYILDFVAPCGIFIRFDHLYTLTPQLMQLVDAQLPPARVDESRTTNFNSNLTLQQGDLVATEVGHKQPFNVGFDLGVYDLRKSNAKSQDAAWAAAHADEKEQAYFAICWLNNLPGSAKQIALRLPGGGTEGKISDYCD